MLKRVGDGRFLFLCKTLVFLFLPFLNLGAQIRSPQNQSPKPQISSRSAPDIYIYIYIYIYLYYIYLYIYIYTIGVFLGDVPVTHIFKCDKTNLKVDPGCSWEFVVRVRKRVENVRDTSKTPNSVMWCGFAAEECLPPMVRYKAGNLYQGWVQGDCKVLSMTATSLDSLTRARVKFGFQNFLEKK